MGEASREYGCTTSVSVVIVNWNARAWLSRCLAALRESTTPCEIIVVDNASTDGSVELVRDQFPECLVLANPGNAGFARANNQGIQMSHSDVVLLLNPDALVEPNTIGLLTDYLRAQPGVGAVGPRMLNPDGSLQYSCRAFPTLGAGFFRQTPLGGLFPHNRFTADYLMTDWPHDAPRNVDWLSGACVMLRKQALSEIGGLDEGFYMYCEDVDLCLRLWQRDWKVAYVPAAVMVHAIGQSSNRVQGRMIIERHHAMLRYYLKHHARRQFLLLPVVLAGLATRCLGALVRLNVNRMIDRLKQRGSRQS